MLIRPKLIGITGGIGSGKSTVCKVFELLGHKVYYADDRGKWLMNHEASLKRGIRTLFGNNAYFENTLNKKYIGNLVFKSPDLLEKLNELVHPAVAIDLQKWILENNQEKILFDESALLFEVGSYKEMDLTILVTAPKEIRIQRVISRDDYRTETSVKEIMNQQMEDKKKIDLADFVVQNDNKQSIIKQIMNLYHYLA
ncbi:MAG: dephospho-CoA kinase [Bacteroidota bacterium]